MNTYETDFYSWTQEQANLLKLGRLMELDVQNLIEEVEDMGANKRSALKSRLTVLMAHLLKWQFQPERKSRSWQLTINEQRLEIEYLLEENPGLKHELPDLMVKAYRIAKLQAEKQTKLDGSVFPKDNPWRFKQMIDADFFPND
jgi:hypothetical protein